MTEWILLGLGVLLTLGTAIFVAAEFSLVALDRSTVERAVESGDKRAPSVLAAIRSLSTQLSGAQVGITITTLLVGYLVRPSLATLLQAPAEAVGLEGAAVDSVTVALALIAATAFSMVVGELIPKNLAISVPLPTARVVAGPQRAFTTVTRPLITVLNGSANRLLRLVGVEPQEELSAGRSADELAALVRHSAEVGTLDQQTATLLTRSLGFSSRSAADVMTPRVRMLVLQKDEPAAAAITLARRTGHSRFPVVDGDLDDVVGVVHLKSAVAVPMERRDEVPVAAFMSEALRVPETMRLDPLLVELRALGLQLAVVVDEYGGTAGVVTLEDLVEELVGDVSDEHDRSRPGIVRRRDGAWLVPGLMRPDEVRERTGVGVPDGNAYETLGGFVMAGLGRIPAVGDEVPVEGARVRVERMDGRRVDRVRLILPDSATPDRGASADPAKVTMNTRPAQRPTVDAGSPGRQQS
ncbi:hemolysin family protein [Kineosporia rhizophila]|uniref:hemolysin family protein n=1 Tax=Kineosporia TaxID=49184 RepID=UPI001E2F4E05|nr:MULTISPECIES: hemolysin family protein [Kineosporia]MCE0539639.1 hemolysin family protein [Kineosporia rhizophila]GLY17934.1 membrane protein [Kineosporia sp. NBRC 101677]